MPIKKRREIFARNLQRYIDMSGKSRGSFCESIGITAASLSEWLNAKKYPRIDTIEDFLEILVKKNYSKSYIKDIKGTLSSILAYGVDEKIIYNNPCYKERISRKVRSKNARDSFTPSELKQIEKYYKEIPFGYTVYTMLKTGMRAQEICAIGKHSLLVKDNQRYIHIYRAMKRMSNGAWIFGDPKSDNSFRDIPVSKEIYNHIATTILSNKHGLYLPRKDGQPISYTLFLEKYKAFFTELQKKADVRYLPPHCCRHTFSSSLEWEKVSPFVIRDLMGHSDVEMTNDYTHASDEERIAAVKKNSLSKSKQISVLIIKGLLNPCPC